MSARILNVGSLNIDYVYAVPHAVQPGETLAATGFGRGPGGKGLNQSVAAARAGAHVRHLGAIGPEGQFLRDLLVADGVDCEHVRECAESATGHAIIQVAADGENCIVLFPGANHLLRPADIDAACAAMVPGTWLLMQNEVNDPGSIIAAARRHGLRIALNTAPADAALLQLPLPELSLLVCNESEGALLSGAAQPEAIMTALRERCPQTAIVLTLGKQGCIAAHGDNTWRIPAEPVQAVDSTAAGDTFVGYLLAALANDEDLETAATRASHAAAISVTRHGAADSIPYLREL